MIRLTLELPSSRIDFPKSFPKIGNGKVTKLKLVISKDSFSVKATRAFVLQRFACELLPSQFYACQFIFTLFIYIDTSIYLLLGS